MDAEARRLGAEEEDVRRQRAAALFEEIDTLNRERLALLGALSPDKRAAVTGFAAAGWEQAASEARQLTLIVRYHRHVIGQWLSSLRHPGRAAEHVLAGGALQILECLLARRRLRVVAPPVDAAAVGHAPASSRGRPGRAPARAEPGDARDRAGRAGPPPRRVAGAAPGPEGLPAGGHAGPARGPGPVGARDVDLRRSAGRRDHQRGRGRGAREGRPAGRDRHRRAAPAVAAPRRPGRRRLRTDPRHQRDARGSRHDLSLGLLHLLARVDPGPAPSGAVVARGRLRAHRAGAQAGARPAVGPRAPARLDELRRGHGGRRVPVRERRGAQRAKLGRALRHHAAGARLPVPPSARQARRADEGGRPHRGRLLRVARARRASRSVDPERLGRSPRAARRAHSRAKRAASSRSWASVAWARRPPSPASAATRATRSCSTRPPTDVEALRARLAGSLGLPPRTDEPRGRRPPRSPGRPRVHALLLDNAHRFVQPVMGGLADFDDAPGGGEPSHGQDHVGLRARPTSSGSSSSARAGRDRSSTRSSASSRGARRRS